MFEIMYPEKQGDRYVVIPKYGSGECWLAETEEEAKQILRFVKNRDPKYIDHIQVGTRGEIK